MEHHSLVCVVTGGSQGIGQAIIQKLLSHNCIVYNLDIKSPTQSSMSSSSSAVLGGSNKNASACSQHSSLTYLPTDISQPKEFASRIKEIYEKEHHHLDVLVNNAGIFETEENSNQCWDETVSMDTINRILETNLGSVIHGTRIATQYMKQQLQEEEEHQQQHQQDEHTATKSPGTTTATKATTTIPVLSRPPPATTTTTTTKKIINIASTAALGPFLNHPIYASTKAAVLHFSQIADMDLRTKFGIRVHCICPGIIDTEMGRMGGKRNALAVEQLKYGKRTKPELVAEALWNLLRQPDNNNDDDDVHPEMVEDCYIVVDDHEIQSISF